MYDLLCLGEPMFEFSHIAPSENSASNEWRDGFGGDVSNVAVAAALHGAKVGVVSQLGDDSFGHAMRDFWQANNVDDQHVSTHQNAPTGVYFIRQGETGHSFEYRRTGSAAAVMTPECLGDLSTRVLHFSGISLAISDSAKATALSAAEKVRANGGQLSYDPNLRLNLTTLAAAQADQAAVLEAGCTIALPGFDDAKVLTQCNSPDAIADWYLNAGVELVALTLGDAGALIANSNERFTLPQRTTQAVDASGAGDCFDGCFLARLQAGDTIRQAAEYAIVAASLSVENYGAATAIPQQADVFEQCKHYRDAL